MSDLLWQKPGVAVDAEIQRFLAGDDVLLDREFFLHDIQASTARQIAAGPPRGDQLGNIVVILIAGAGRACWPPEPGEQLRARLRGQKPAQQLAFTRRPKTLCRRREHQGVACPFGSDAGARQDLGPVSRARHRQKSGRGHAGAHPRRIGQTQQDAPLWPAAKFPTKAGQNSGRQRAIAHGMAE